MAFTVSIVIGNSFSDSRAFAQGSDKHLITKAEREAFKLGTHEDLKNAIGRMSGWIKPDNATLRATDTDGGAENFAHYGWPETVTSLTAIKADILGITKEPTILQTRVLRNNSNVPGDFSASISEEVTSTMETNWTNSQSVSIDSTVTIGVTCDFLSIDASTSIGSTKTFGQGGSTSVSNKVGSATAVTVHLNPGESVKAVLNAFKVTMKVRVTYEAELSGGASVNYSATYNKHHYWYLDIGSILRGGVGTENSVLIYEDVTIGYYSDGEVTLSDIDGNPKTYEQCIPGHDNYHDLL